MNVYTIMLIVAFIAICLACLAMYFDLQRYGQHPWWDTSEAAPSASAAGSLQSPSDARFAWQMHEPAPRHLEVPGLCDPPRVA